MSTTVGSQADALRLARELVARRLAACVQLEPGLTSVYRWEGKVCEDAEVRLVAKTVAERLEAVQAFFAEHHPYDLPQFLACPMQASEAYAGWVRAETLPEA
ncbi:MAG: divalent-cation tolerance protein CutA [Pseudomonadota bacterium]